MPERKISKSTLAVAVILITIFLAAVYYITTIPYYVPPAAPKYKYTENIVAGFRVTDITSGSSLTSNILPQLYPAGSNPFAKNFVNKSIATAAYTSNDPTLGACWTVVADMGTYVLLVKDTATTKTKYPELVDFTVPGSNQSTRTEWGDPSQINMVQRASVSITTSILAYNTTSGAYDISVSNLNVTKYTKWRVTITFAVAGDLKELYPGYIYFTEVTNLSPTTANLDGDIVAIESDKDASDDSLTGYRVQYAESWEGGETHTLTIFFEKVASVSATTITVQVADYYEVQNTNLKWWTYPSTTISVVT
ncbi:MAG: hypothetical protein DRJ03_25290 [Chloroflexi bacterium]|nr:MAG: hypothetical protein DRJ03_25290 [Chloroflexota bacterium]